MIDAGKRQAVAGEAILIVAQYLNAKAPRHMEGKARFVFPVVITAIIVFVVSGAVTFFNIGWRNDFVIRWWSAFAIGWPIAAGTAYLAMPFARSLTRRIVAAIERTV
jgi:TRAP-type C4-dicarboxylate transport system permease small subunit